MNYRHAFHAGNFADVIKHVALTAVLLHLRKKEKPFCVIDSHAGRGLYDLRGSETERTREAVGGIVRLADLVATNTPTPLFTYLECVHAEGEGHYPGSPRIAARLLRPQDLLVAIEKHPEEATVLAQSLASFANAKGICADGYERLPALLPPRERRGVVLIDPPYEAPDEFTRAAGLLAQAHRRFATGTYLLWFPIKSKADAEALCGEVLARGIAHILRIDIDIDARANDARLAAAGLLVVNAPFGFEADMRAAAAILAPRLGRRPVAAAKISITALA